MAVLKQLEQLWSTTRFSRGEVTRYAEDLMLRETRVGIQILCGVSLLLLLGFAGLIGKLGLSDAHLYTAGFLGVLALHVANSARSIHEIRALHALGMTFLVLSGVAFVLLAHRTGSFDATLFASVTLLFVVIPLVPWGLREATCITALTYLVFTSSTWSTAQRFEASTLWVLQSLMLGVGSVSLVLVARGAALRRQDIEARYDLDVAKRQVEHLSLEDALTGTWNRRYLEAEYAGLVEQAHKAQQRCVFAILDIDGFKPINDRMGHAVGDRVLQWLVRSLHTHLGDAGVVVRLGGDEFVVIARDIEIETLLEDALASTRALASSEATELAEGLGLSAGVLELPARTQPSLEEVYLAADGALYRAKRAQGESPKIAWAELRRDGAATP